MSFIDRLFGTLKKTASPSRSCADTAMDRSASETALARETARQARQDVVQRLKAAGVGRPGTP